MIQGSALSLVLTVSLQTNGASDTGAPIHPGLLIPIISWIVASKLRVEYRRLTLAQFRISAANLRIKERRDVGSTTIARLEKQGDHRVHLRWRDFVHVVRRVR